MHYGFGIRKLIRPLGLRMLGTITHVVTDKPVAALTFDDGPHELYTERLLEVLDRYAAKATFFMVGRAALENPELVRKVYEQGHAIGNHTFNHTALTSAGFFKGIKEVYECRNALKPYQSRIMRLPWGKQTIMIRCIPLLFGYKVIAWNASAQDWTGLSAQVMTQKLHNALRPGCILLMHDRIYSSVSETPQFNRNDAIEAVGLLLEKAANNYSFVTVPQLLTEGKPYLVNWQRK